jgi:uncharacterized protein (DUF305 family)
MMGMMGMRSSSMIHEEVDENFIEQMIPHHEDAIAMADTALTKAEHEEIKLLSRDINRSQSQEIEQMRTWYKAWFGSDPAQANFFPQGMGMQMGMMGNMTDVDDLKNAKPFDKEFIEQMIPHHQMAVMMSQMLLRSTDRVEMKKLAEDIISAQTREIEQMRSWYKAWYK